MSIQRLSIANRERASNPPYPYKGGVKGYSGIEEDLVCFITCMSYICFNDYNLYVLFQFVCSCVQLLAEGQDPTTRSLERHELWLEARRNKEGIIEHPPTLEVYDKIVSVVFIF